MHELTIIALSYAEFNINKRVGFIMFTMIIIIYIENLLIVYELIEVGL